MNSVPQKRLLIVGATSGIGFEVAKQSIQLGWIVGIAGRRLEKLEELKSIAPDQVFINQLDVTLSDSPQQLLKLIETMGGMDIFLLCSGIGKQNKLLNQAIELQTIETNADGFIRMVTTAYQFFTTKQQGHIAVISSIAGTKGLGAAPAYSATKAFQSTYIEALAQLVRLRGQKICFTDIRPGFVDTDLLNGNYPLLMKVEPVAKQIINALIKRKSVLIIDWRYRILVFFWKMIPRWLWIRLPIQTK